MVTGVGSLKPIDSSLNRALYFSLSTHDRPCGDLQYSGAGRGDVFHRRDYARAAGHGPLCCDYDQWRDVVYHIRPRLDCRVIAYAVF